MSIKLDYGTDDDAGQYIGPWITLEIGSPDGDACGELLSPDDARGLAGRLQEAASITEARAEARRQTGAGMRRPWA